MNIFLNIVLGIGIACIIMGIIQSHNPGVPILTPFAVFNSLVVSFMVGYFVGDVVPGLVWGMKLAGAMHLGKGGSYIVMCIIQGLCMGFFIGLGSGYISNIANGFAAVLQFYGAFLWVIMLSAAILVIIAFKPFGKLAGAISGCNPFSAPPEDAVAKKAA